MNIISVRTRQLLLGCPVLLFVVIILSMLMGSDKDSTHCEHLLDHGRWTGRNSAQKWNAYGSLIHRYDEATTYQCLENQTLYFAGDSTIRQIFWAIAEKLDGYQASTARKNAAKHTDLTYDKDNATLLFLWDPFLDRSDTLKEIGYAREDAVGILLSTGLWQIRFRGENYLQAFYSSFYGVVSWFGMRKRTTNPLFTCYKDNCAPAIFVPPPHLNFDLLNQDRAKTLTKLSVHMVSQALEQLTQHSRLEVAWSTQKLTLDNPSALDETGLHVTSETAALQADILLNRLCNGRTIYRIAKTAYACTEVSNVRLEKWLAGICLCLAAWMALTPHVSQDLPFRSTDVQATIVLLLAVCYCGLTDRTLLFDKSDKVTSQMLFVILSCLLVGTSLRSTRRLSQGFSTKLPSPNSRVGLKSMQTGLLSRSQTEEWKGWMQIVILLYHYFGMSKVLWVYKFVRVLVASYLFLTGYGHATYFQTTRDFSAQRLVAVLVRLNTLPVLLAYAMNNTYDFYYFPGLASFWVLVTVITFWRHSEHETATYRLTRILVALAMLSLLLSCEPVINLLTTIVRIGYGPNLNPKELLFRIKLDLYVPYFGMATSVLMQCSASLSRRSETLMRSCSSNILQVMLINIALVLLIGYIVLAQSFADKVSYNHWHSILSILPITAYAILRNANDQLRSLEVPVLRWIGRISLELFVLQYHIWLAADAKGILRLGLLDIPVLAHSNTVTGSWTFWLETALITVVLVWLSDHCAQATNTITKIFVYVDAKTCSEQQRTIILTRVCILLAALWLLNVALQIGCA